MGAIEDCRCLRWSDRHLGRSRHALPSGYSGLWRGLKYRIEYAAATRPCVHRVDALRRAEDSGFIQGDTDLGPGLTIVGASQDAGAEVRMEGRHEDDAAVVRSIDLHLPVQVLVLVDLFPPAPGRSFATLRFFFR